MPDELDLSYARALKLILPQESMLQLALVGCGGTGSWLAPAVVRVACLLVHLGKQAQVYFIDPDRVDIKNVYRQNFCMAEIGRPKACTLAERYGSAWGVEIVTRVEKFGELPVIPGLMVVIGCVDGAAGRRSIQEFVQNSCYRPVWWLDCGNTKNYGQVLLGTACPEEDPFRLPGFCSWLPLPGVQHPELLEDEPEYVFFEPLSCAEMALADSQGLGINQRMAAEAADYLVRMLITKDLRKFATYIDLESGTVRSKYIHKDEEIFKAKENLG